MTPFWASVQILTKSHEQGRHNRESTKYRQKQVPYQGEYPIFLALYTPYPYIPPHFCSRPYIPPYTPYIPPPIFSRLRRVFFHQYFIQDYSFSLLDSKQFGAEVARNFEGVYRV